MLAPEVVPTPEVPPGELQRTMESIVGKVLSNVTTVEFEVENVPVEQRETSMREDVAEQIANLSGGKRILFDPEEELDDNATSHSFEGLGSLLGADKAPKTLIIRREKTLWDIPVIFVILILITGVEWYLRRRENLV